MPKSEVWKHVLKLNNKEVKCNYCAVILTNCNNTTNYWTHLKKHNVCPENSSLKDSQASNSSGLLTSSEARMERRRSLPVEFNINTPRKKQQTLTSVIHKAESFADGGNRCIELNDALIYMICKDGLSLNTSEKRGFVKFCKVAVPIWQPPSRKTVTRLIDEKHNVVKLQVKNVIRSIPGMCLTFDVWTDSHTTTSYVGGSLHFLNNLDLETCTLSVTELHESHTSIYLESVIRDVCDDWQIGIEKVSLAVKDNAANITNAVQKVFGQIKVAPCFDHTLNLIPQYAIGCNSKKEEHVPGLPSLISKVRSIVTFVHHSVLASDQMKQLQLEEGRTEGTVLRLVQQVPTKWSSTYFMIARFLELSTILGSVLLNFDKITMLNGAEMKTLRSIADVLHPLQIVTQEMSADSDTTARKVIPIINVLKETLDQLDISDDIPSKLKKFILSELNRSFQDVEWNHTFAVAAILDPRFKSLHFKNCMALAKAKNFLSPEIRKLMKIEAKIIEEPSICQLRTSNNLWQVHDNFVKLHRERQSQEVLVEEGMPTELREYLNTAVTERTTNPFKTWDSLKFKYPNLYSIAQKYLICIATSVPSERLFSQAKLVLTDLRSRLTSDHLAKLLFLKSVSEKLWATATT